MGEHGCLQGIDGIQCRAEPDADVLSDREFRPLSFTQGAGEEQNPADQCDQCDQIDHAARIDIGLPLENGQDAACGENDGYDNDQSSGTPSGFSMSFGKAYVMQLQISAIIEVQSQSDQHESRIQTANGDHPYGVIEQAGNQMNCHEYGREQTRGDEHQIDPEIAVCLIHGDKRDAVYEVSDHGDMIAEQYSEKADQAVNEEQSAKP